MSFPIVRSSNTGTTSGTPATLAFSPNVFSGSMLYLFSVSTVLTETISGITDTRGNTWASIVATNVGAYRFECWRAPSGAAGANTASVTFSAHTVAKRMWVAEVTGIGTSPTLQSGSTDVTVAVDPIPGHALTITDLQGIAFCMIQLDTTNAGFTWSPITHVDMSGGTQGRMAAFAVGSVSPSFAPTLDLTSGTESGEAITIVQYTDPQPASGGGTVVHGHFG